MSPYLAMKTWLAVIRLRLRMEAINLDTRVRLFMIDARAAMERFAIWVCCGPL